MESVIVMGAPQAEWGAKALGERDNFARITKAGVPKDEVRINGRFAYAIKHKPLNE